MGEQYTYPKYNLTTTVKLEGELQLELFCYLHNWRDGRQFHFRNIARILWGPNNKTKEFFWHPWAEAMNEVCHLYRFPALSGAASTGKCCAPETKVVLGDGRVVSAREIKVGDQLCGDDGGRRTVLTTKTGRSNMVRIVPEKGDPWECNDDHILSLKRAWVGKKSRRKVGEIIDISVKDYLQKSTTFKRQHKSFCAGTEFPDQPVDFNPRAYGIWLGNGSKNRAMITSPDHEPEVNAYLTGYFIGAGFNYRKEYYGKSCPTYLISTKAGNSRNSFLDFARESCATGEKRILPRYLINSRQKRMELLAGLIDSDGYAGGTHFEISSSFDGLTEDIAFLARSLGFRVTVTKRTTKCNGKVFPSNRINVLGDVCLIPTLRKKCSPKKLRTGSECTSFKVEQLGVGDWCGWTLDGNGRFLLGDFTVTHNSEFAAIYAIISWLSDPSHTLVLVTTTGLKDAQFRIWGAIEKYWLACPGLPGKLLSSQYQIYTTDGSGQKLSGQCGIRLIAGEKKKQNDSMAKLIGAKANRVFLIADELPELSEALVTTAIFNLSSNPYFQMLGIGNFKSRYDSFGTFVQPKDGWDSIDIDTDEWETTKGYCVRFDGMKSPNVLAGKVLYKGLYTADTLQTHRRSFGENTAEFYRMCRSFEAPIGLDDAIYSESDFLAGKAYEVAGRDCLWLDRRTRWSAMDPSFTSGGDRCVQCFGWFGIMNGRHTISVDKFMILRDDVRVKDKTRSRQIAEQFRDNCVAEGVKPEHAALDATAGGGIVLSDYIAEVWSNNILRVDFSGAPTDSWIGADGSKTCKEVFDRKVSELWGVGVDFLKYGQLKGLTPELTREMKARKKDSVKGAAGLKMRVETKKDMKARLGFSPDLADTYFVGLSLCRERLGAVAGGPESHYSAASESWSKQCELANNIYARGEYMQ